MSKNIIIVTGGAGFVGSNLIKALSVFNKFKIISIDDYSSGTKKNHIKNKKVKYLKSNTKSISIILKNYRSKNHIKCIYEKPNSLKIGHYVPNTNIPIISDNKLNRINKKDVIINFAWHIKKEIKEYLIKKKINNKIINII
ncbi:NAD-dependent epimerase/dehydratase family protein [Candidatus Pelagibacter sp.]|nr:NAD-dependent epimerase/dehydratase family protein [Candidatus Pelagibacter sp.]